MCGRYASTASRADLLEQFVVEEKNADELRGPDFNVAPTKQAPVVIARAGNEDGDPVRELRSFRWGLLPFWAKDIKVGAKMVNARAESVHEKPAYRRAFKSQRALIPVDAFYEWLETDQVGKSGKPLKQPFALPVNCTKHSRLGGRFLSERTWCGDGLAAAVGGGAGRPATGWGGRCHWAESSAVHAARCLRQ
jgi:hypothetical protein